MSLSARCLCSCRLSSKSKPVLILVILEAFRGRTSEETEFLALPRRRFSIWFHTRLLTYSRMGYSALMSQALAAPPYLVAFIVVLLTSWFSDRWRNRSFFVCFHALLAATGYSVFAIAGAQGENANAIWRYAAVYPAATGRC